MASKLSEEVVGHVARVVTESFAAGPKRDVSGELVGAATLDALQRLFSNLRDRCSEAFSSDGLDRTVTALTKLTEPASARAPWPAVKDRKRGLFVVFEGLDRSGKSTQSRALTKSFEGREAAVRWTCFPERTLASGILIDLYLRRKIEMPDDAVHLLFSANRWEAAATIVEDLNKGVTVICDRYAFSGVAYSAAKGLDFEWCQSPDIGLPTPDAVFFLHLNPEVGKTRADFGDERYENVDMQARVREEFQRTALHGGVNWNAIDAAREVETISKEIRAIVDDIEAADSENHRLIKQLWLA